MTSALRIPTFSQAIAKVRENIRNRNKNLNTQAGSVFGDVFVTPRALSDVQLKALNYFSMVSKSPTELLALKDDSDTLAVLATAYNVTVEDMLTLISTQIKGLAGNFSVVRKAAIKSVGTILYGRVDPPTQDLVVDVGNTVQASSGQDFVTTSAVQMYASAASTYFDPERQLYVIEVPVQAVIAGEDGNAPAETVNRMITPVAGFTYVTNGSAIDNGEDEWSDEQLVSAMSDVWTEPGDTTGSGIKKNIADNVLVDSIWIAPAYSEFSPRGGRTDIYIKRVVEDLVTETFSGYNSDIFTDGIRPTQQPVVGISSYNSGAAYLQRDTDSALVGSMQAKDTIRFSTNPVWPVTITYIVDRRVREAQEVFNNDEYAPANQLYPDTIQKALLTPWLVKQADVQNIDYTATITVKPGFLKADVIATVKANLLEFSGTWLIGDTTYQTDLNEVVENSEGVLRLTGTPAKFSKTEESGVADSITPNDNQYNALNNLNIF